MLFSPLVEKPTVKFAINALQITAMVLGSSYYRIVLVRDLTPADTYSAAMATTATKKISLDSIHVTLICILRSFKLLTET